MMNKIKFLTFVLLLSVIFGGCISGPEDEKDIYTITFVNSYTVLSVNESWNETPAGDPVEVETWETFRETETIITDTLGRLLRLPADPARQGYNFSGWFTSGGTQVSKLTVFTTNTTVFARWGGGVEAPKPFTEWLKVVQNEAKSGEEWEFKTFLANETIDTAHLLEYSGVNDITIILTGTDGVNGYPPILSLSTRGSLFTVGRGVTLILNNIWIQGNDRNSDALLSVNDGGKLIINDGTLIYNNGSEGQNSGGGVQVNTGGTFIMDGGEIQENVSFDTSADWTTSVDGGGGVLVRGGHFVMHDGKIHRNAALDGGGVYVTRGGTFVMNGGEIFDNSAPYSGGGILVNDGWVELYDGKIYGNQTLDGGGIMVNRGRRDLGSAIIFDPKGPHPGDADYDEAVHGRKEGLFMYGGEIYKNGVGSAGGGIYNSWGAHTHMYGGKVYENSGWSVAGIANAGTFNMYDGAEVYKNSGGYGGGLDTFDGSFIMWGGQVYDNYADGSSGGVMVNAPFFMHGGEIYGNRSINAGGGLYITANGSFFMTGGIIYGTDTDDPERLPNTHAASYPNSAVLYFVFDYLDASAIGSAIYGTLGNSIGNSITPSGISQTTDSNDALVSVITSVLEETDKTIEVVDGVLVRPTEW